MNHPNTPPTGADGQPRPPRRWRRVSLPILIWGAIFAVILYALLWGGRSPDIEVADLPGVQSPRTAAASQSNLPDQALVIGVSMNGRHRAYALSVMADINCHVVNDLFGETPITVAYCDRSNCVTAYQGDSADAPLAIGIGGYLNDGTASTMLIKEDGILYRQDDGRPLRADDPPFPHQTIEITRTTWQAWRTIHPDTDVYDGDTRRRGGELR